MKHLSFRNTYVSATQKAPEEKSDCWKNLICKILDHMLSCSCIFRFESFMKHVNNTLLLSQTDAGRGIFAPNFQSISSNIISIIRLS